MACIQTPDTCFRKWALKGKDQIDTFLQIFSCEMYLLLCLDTLAKQDMRLIATVITVFLLV